MKKDCKLSDVLHILLHMAEINRPVTSERLAKMMQTNPVVVRRILAGLREQGYITSEKGHHGGWRLDCDLRTVTLHDIYLALGKPTVFAIGNRNDAPDCLVEDAVNTVMNQAYRAAEAVLLARFSEVSLAALSQHVHQRIQERGVCSGQKTEPEALIDACVIEEINDQIGS
jgi:DNA-binding IscR family transcriptional regulator